MTTCCLGSVPKNKGIVSKYSNMKSNWNDNQTEKRLALTCFNISISTCPFDMKAGLHRDIPNPFFLPIHTIQIWHMPQHPKEMYLTVSSMHFKKAWEASPSRIPLNRTCQSSLKLNLHIFWHFLLPFLRGNLQPNTIPCLKNQHTLPSNNKNATISLKISVFF